MTESPLIVRGLEDLVAYIPHRLGVEPVNSVVVFPTDPGSAPISRVDLPRTPDEVEMVAKGIVPAYAERGTEVVLLAYTDRRDLAEAACEGISAALGPACPVVAAVTVNGDRWVRLDRPEHGVVSQAVRDRFAAEGLYRSGKVPYSSPSQHKASFAPSPHAIPVEVMASARAAAATALRSPDGIEGERAWMRVVLNRHVISGGALSDPDAARLLSNVQDIELRDHAWTAISRQDADRHAHLWKDVLTRSPAGLQAPAAALAAYGFWIGGDGISARVALEQIPPEQPYSMANLIGTALAAGIDPKTMPVPNELPEGFFSRQPPPPTGGVHAERRVPPSPPQSGPTPGATR